MFSRECYEGSGSTPILANPTLKYLANGGEFLALRIASTSPRRGPDGTDTGAGTSTAG